jgi:hypothetical protein
MHEPPAQRPGATEGPGPLSPLERTVLSAILERLGASAEREALRAQLTRASVVSRTHSGVGFVTRIAVPDTLFPIDESSAPRLAPLFAAHPQLTERAEFLLQLRGGRLAVLEAYCFEGGWPADEAEFRVVG